MSLFSGCQQWPFSAISLPTSVAFPPLSNSQPELLCRRGWWCCWNRLYKSNGGAERGPEGLFRELRLWPRAQTWGRWRDRFLLKGRCEVQDGGDRPRAVAPPVTRAQALSRPMKPVSASGSRVELLHARRLRPGCQRFRDERARPQGVLPCWATPQSHVALRQQPAPQRGCSLPALPKALRGNLESRRETQVPAPFPLLLAG